MQKELSRSFGVNVRKLVLAGTFEKSFIFYFSSSLLKRKKNLPFLYGVYILYSDHF